MIAEAAFLHRVSAKKRYASRTVHGIVGRHRNSVGRKRVDRTKRLQPRSKRQAARLFGAAALASPLGWIGYSALAIDHQVPLPSALDSIRRVFRSGMAGSLSY